MDVESSGRAALPKAVCGSFLEQSCDGLERQQWSGTIELFTIARGVSSRVFPPTLRRLRLSCGCPGSSRPDGERSCAPVRIRSHRRTPNGSAAPPFTELYNPR